MKENELMIGDWVRLRYNDYLTKQEVVKDFKVGQLRYTYWEGRWENMFVGDDHQNMGYVEKIEPIPLTAEILEKNFPTYEGLAWEPSDMLDTIPAFTIRIDEDFAHIEIDLRYVHELQHTLRLCGIEKEIKL